MPTYTDSLPDLVRRIEIRLSALESAYNIQGGPPADAAVDLPITGLTASSLAFRDPVSGLDEASLIIGWDAITTDPDDLDADPVDYYLVSYQLPGQTEWSPEASTEDNTIVINGLPLNVLVTYRVRAVSKRGVHGDYAQGTFTTAFDTTAPNQPSTPTVVSRLGQILVTWDGKDNGGGSMPSDFRELQVHASESGATFTPSSATLKGVISSRTGGDFPITTGLTYGTTVYVRTVAVDLSNNTSPPSVAGSATPERLSGLDLESGAISYKTIGYKDEGNLVIDGSFERADTVANAVAQSNTLDAEMIYWRDVSVGFHGTSSLKAEAAAATTINSYLNLTPPPNEPSSNDRAMAIPIREDDQFFVRYAYMAEAGATGTWRVELRWGNANGTSIGVQSMTLNLANTTMTEFSTGNITAPAGSVFLTVRLYTGAGATGTVWLDAVEVRKKISTALIEDAAITNALIANGAIDNLKVANVDGGKITALSITATQIATNAITADKILAGAVTAAKLSATAIDGKTITGALIRTASSGQRIEMNSTGVNQIAFYPSGGSNKALISAINDTALGSAWAAVKISATQTGSELYVGNGVTELNQGTSLPFTSTIRLDGGDINITSGTNVDIATSALAMSFNSLTLNDDETAYNFDIKGTSGNHWLFRIWGTSSMGALKFLSSSSSLQVRNAGDTTYGDLYANTFRYIVAPSSFSSRRFKTDIQPLAFDVDAFLNLTPYTYAFDYPEFPDHSPGQIGLMAEDVDAAGIKGLVEYGEDGLPEGLRYGLIPIMLLPIIRDLRNRVIALEGGKRTL